jgi:hypothetical protein
MSDQSSSPRIIELALQRAHRCVGVGALIAGAAVLLAIASASSNGGGYVVLPIGMFAVGAWQMLKGTVGAVQLSRERRQLGYAKPERPTDSGAW